MTSNRRTAAWVGGAAAAALLYAAYCLLLKEVVRARPHAWSGWMVAVLAAVVVGLLTFFYDAGRAAVDARNAMAARGVHGTLTVTECTAQEYGFECEGTFRADDGSACSPCSGCRWRAISWSSSGERRRRDRIDGCGSR